MTRARCAPIARAAVAFVLMTACSTVAAAEGSVSYRGFTLGATVRSVLEASRLSAAAVRTLHRRPHSIQSLEWRMPYVMGPVAAAGSDPVRRIVFSFYEDQLYRIDVDYDQERTEGLGAADVIDVFSQTYGSPITPVVELACATTARPIAQWKAAGTVLMLSQAPGLSDREVRHTFTFTMISPRLVALSAAAIAEATRLDASEAPGQEVARLKTEAEEALAAATSRAINRPNFRP